MYAVQRSGVGSGGAGGAAEWTAVTVVGERVRTRVERLRPRTAYSFKMQARNSKGLGPFSPIVGYTTGLGGCRIVFKIIAMYAYKRYVTSARAVAEAGAGGGLAGATSAWLWASAGGACAVLALAAALALSLCCRRHAAPLSPDTRSVYTELHLHSIIQFISFPSKYFHLYHLLLTNGQLN